MHSQRDKTHSNHSDASRLHGSQVDIQSASNHSAESIAHSEHDSSLPSSKSTSRFSPRTIIRLVRRFLFRSAAIFVLLLVAYAVAAWSLSHIPTNRGFVTAEDGVEIGLTSNGVHVNFILPATHDVHDWQNEFHPDDFLGSQGQADWVVIGWGNRRFYLETPQWSDIRLQTVLESLSGFGDTAMHVEWKVGAMLEDETTYRVRMSRDQYQSLCQSILRSFRRNSSDQLIPIADAHYRNTDAFYEATGHYHIFNTCNAWVGDCLRHAGVRVGWWTPTPGGVMASLPPEPTPQTPSK